MRCHKCNQDSIKIVMDDDLSKSTIHIICDICGLDIDSGDNPMLCDLFIYNENLEAAEKLGIEAYIEDKKIGDNPYTLLQSDQILLNKRWEIGFNKEKDSYEKEALLISAENLKYALEKMEEEKTILTEQQAELSKNHTKLSKKVKKLSKIGYLMGYKYKKDLLKIVLEIPDK